MRKRIFDRGAAKLDARRGLVLTRRNGETIQIGEVTIRVVRVSASRVRLQILADRGVHILRGELLEEPLAAA